jgi:glyoxylase-like metal-dependent hydrolase (beta-lactamase superfamily II)
MLKQITDGVWVHESNFLQSNAVVVQGNDGVLLIDPGITSDEMVALAEDIQELDQQVVAGFSTHPHWDHLLWHAKFGEAPRYGTARNEADIKAFLSNPDWKTAVAPMLPADIADQIPMDDRFGKITGLLAGTTYLSWDGPKVRVIEHQGHAAGSAALLVEDSGVLVAGDMVSDILIPFLELDADDPIKDYLAALQLFEGVTDKIKFFVPGHGSVGDANEMRARIKQDRAYVQALRGGGNVDDPRLTSSPNNDVHAWQMQQIAQKNTLKNET